MTKSSRFTDLGVERSKSPKDREKLLTEGGGLYLRITPKGKKVWLHYGKTRKWHKLGEYPALTVKDAREENDKLKVLTDKGMNPVEMNSPGSDPTVREFFDRWHSEATGKTGKPWAPLYKTNVGYLFEADILPYIGGVKVRDVTKSNVAHIIQKIIDRKATGHARHVYRRLNRFFSYAAELDIIESSPMATMPTKGTATTLDKVLKVDEIKVFLSKIHNIDMAENTARALELILRTGQRPGECEGIHKNEVEGNWWTIPGERTKNGLTHRVYLTDEVLQLLGTPGRNGYYLESIVTGKPLFRNVAAKALRRSLTGKEKTQKDKSPSLPMDSFTPRDLRRTCATHLAELGFTDDVIGAVLNHKKRSVTGIYNRHQYDNEKQKALEAWGRKLAKITGSKWEAKVISLSGGAK